MADLSAGRASMPARIAALVAERDGLLAAMPAYLPSAGALTTKLVSLFPRNTDRPTHQAVIVVFDPAHGTPIALMDGEAITAARTAAGSALATDLLARRDARVLAVLGTGVQARAHLRAVPRVRAFAEIRVAGRDAAKAQALAEDARGWLDAPVRAMASYADALAGADVLSAATQSPEPGARRARLGRDGDERQPAAAVAPTAASGTRSQRNRPGIAGVILMDATASRALGDPGRLARVRSGGRGRRVRARAVPHAHADAVPAGPAGRGGRAPVPHLLPAGEATAAAGGA